MNAPALAAAAMVERDARARHYPEMIERGEIAGEEAAADLDAWKAIAAILRLQVEPISGSDGFTNPRISLGVEIAWPRLVDAARTAVERQSKRYAEAPCDQKQAQRLDLLRSIHDHVALEAWFWTGGRGPQPEPLRGGGA